MAEIVYGRWAAMETIRAGRREVQQLALADGVEEKGIIADLVAVAQQKGIPIKRMVRRMMDRRQFLHLTSTTGLACRPRPQHSMPKR